MVPDRWTGRRILVLTSFSSLLAVALALAVIAAFTVGYVERGQTLHIAVGPPGSAELRFIEALQPRLRQGLWQRRLEVLPTEGALASAAAVDDGPADEESQPPEAAISLGSMRIAFFGSRQQSASRSRDCGRNCNSRRPT
jgi:hypothetical protein